MKIFKAFVGFILTCVIVLLVTHHHFWYGAAIWAIVGIVSLHVTKWGQIQISNAKSYGIKTRWRYLPDEVMYEVPAAVGGMLVLFFSFME